jgi:cytidine deaminase
MRNNNLLRNAQEEAMKSMHEFRHGAVLVKDGKIIGSGRNRYSCSIPIGENTRGRSSVHAEEAAIRHTKNCGNARMYVVRVASYGLANSKPCIRCQNLMKNFKIEKVIYSTKTGGTESMFL